jgi:hypothetical protein
MNPDVLLGIAEDIVERGDREGVRLRLFGSLGIRRHITTSVGLLELLGRVPTRDIDFMGYSADQERADRLFAELGYQADHAVSHSLEYGIQRLIYHQREDQLMAEVFLDELRMAHTLDFRGRLELDYPTLSLADLLLTKLQIQQITEKDIKDMIALLAEHDVGSDGPEVVDESRLLALTGDDWGLFYTATKNLHTVEEWARGLDALEPALQRGVVEKTGALISKMETQPKSRRWKLRAKIGTRVRWYEEVGDVHR